MTFLKDSGTFYSFDPALSLQITKREREVYRPDSIKNLLIGQLEMKLKGLKKQIRADALEFEEIEDESRKRP